MLFFLLSLALAADPAPWQPPALPVCSSVSLLTRYDYAYVQANYCELCKSADENACELDWPSSDVPECKVYDQMRNGIYAYYGRAFETEQWKAHFAKLPWYKVNPAYSDALLSAEAKRNVVLLKEMAEKGTSCLK